MKRERGSNSGTTFGPSKSATSSGTILVCIIGLLLIIVCTHTTYAGHDNEPRILESASDQGYIVSWDSHLPILIDGDANFTDTAQLEGWSGNGTVGAPYVIEDLNITGGGTSYCIEIRNTNVFFIVRYCMLTEGVGGIRLVDVRNGQIVHNDIHLTVADWNMGVSLYSSHNNSIAQNNITYNPLGINLENSNNNTIYKNDCSHSTYDGIRLYSSAYNIIDSNIVSHIASGNGIVTWSSSSNRFVDNTAIGNIWGLQISDGSNGNTIENNTCMLCQDGILVGFSGGNLLLKNICMNNSCGITIDMGSVACNVTDNTCMYNTDGIILRGDGHTCADNNVTANGSGIYLWGASNSRMDNNDCSSCSTGIYLRESSGNIFGIHLFAPSNDIGVRLLSSHNNNFTDIICTGCTYGFYLERSSGNSIALCLLENCTYGMYLLTNSQTNLISNNTLIENDYGVYFDWSWGNTIEYNSISEGEFGIYISNTEYVIGSTRYYGSNTIDENEFFNNDLYIKRAGSQVITGNVILGGGLNLIEQSYPDESRQLLVEDNYVNGQPLLFWQDQVSGTILDDMGQIILVNCSSVVIQDQVISGCPLGIALFHCTDISIIDSVVFDNDYGIYLFYSGNNLLDSNNCSFNIECGIYVFKAGSNNVTNNVCIGNVQYGIYTAGDYYSLSDGNLIANNTVRMCNYGIYQSVYSSWSTIARNTCGNNTYGVYIYMSQGSLIRGNSLRNNSYGVYIYICQPCTIYNNTFSDNSYGLYLFYAQGQTVVHSNSMISNQIGLFLDTYVSGCVFDWNVFSNIENNTVDNGSNNVFDYNYWSDYGGADLNHDWIGDTEYHIHGASNNNDTHPILYPPSPFEWQSVPLDQIFELGQSFEFEFQTYPVAPVDGWQINNTLEFSIDSWGVLRNLTISSPGVYVICVNASSIWNVTLSHIFTVTVVAAMPPQWIVEPTTQTVELGTAFEYDLDAIDRAGISHWWLNDTARFYIDEEGVITNCTPLDVGRYGVLVSVTDILGNVQTGSFDIIVMDTTPPSLVETIFTIYVEYGSDYVCKLNATDLSGIDEWWVDDTLRFTVDWMGQVRAASILNIGDYGLRMYVSDIFNNTLEIPLIVAIRDTTPPELTSAVTDQHLDYGESLEYQLVATDLSGISSWTVNDTANFEISSSGWLTSVEILEPGAYPLMVTLSDPYSNEFSVELTVFVAQVTTTTTSTIPPDGGLLTIIAISGTAGAVIVVVIIAIMTRRRASKG